MRLLGKFEYIKKYEVIRNELKFALNNSSWDGEWYKRAFMDDGKCLGASCNKECKIDSIAQSWAVISGAGDKDKIELAMQNLEKNLVDKKTRYYKAS